MDPASSERSRSREAMADVPQIALAAQYLARLPEFLGGLIRRKSRGKQDDERLFDGNPHTVRVGSLPMSLTAETTSASNFASRSNSKNLCVCWSAHASGNCWTTQSAWGFSSH
jgi:hypothetical protein